MCYGEKDIPPSIREDAHAGFVPKPYLAGELRKTLVRLWRTRGEGPG